jgi:hypothetical protein
MDHIIIFIIIMKFLWKPLLCYQHLFDLIIYFLLTALDNVVQLLDCIIRKSEFLLKVFADADGAAVLSLEDGASDFTFHYFSLFLFVGVSVFVDFEGGDVAHGDVTEFVDFYLVVVVCKVTYQILSLVYRLKPQLRFSNIKLIQQHKAIKLFRVIHWLW